MSTYILTVTNGTPNHMAFTATKNGSNLGAFSQDEAGTPLTHLAIFLRPPPFPGGNNQNVGFVSATTPVGNDPVIVGQSWFSESIEDTVFFPPPNPTDGFRNGDCLILLNMTDTEIPLLVLTPGNEAGTTGLVAQSGISVAGMGGMMFVRFGGSQSLPLWTDRPCCVHPDTLVKTRNGEKMIKNIKAGEIVIDKDGNEVQVSFNIEGVWTKRFVNIPTNSLGDNLPNSDLLIKEEHPIFFEGQEIIPKTLMKRPQGDQLFNVTLQKAEPVWSLCTKERIFVMMNNLAVCTWSEKDWMKLVEENPSLYWTQH